MLDVARLRAKYPTLPGYQITDVQPRHLISSPHSVSQERLRYLLHYSPRTGIFTWRHERTTVKAGDIAGKGTSTGYVQIGIDGKRYSAHRLAVLYVDGYMPIDFVDHINLVRSDNRWENLRVATNSQNQMNTPLKSSNTSGFKGVSWHRREKRWRADIRIGSKKVCLGYFATAETAHRAYVDAANSNFGEFARVA